MASKVGFVLVLIIISASFVGTISVARLLVTSSTEDYTAQAQKIFDEAKTIVEQVKNTTLPQTTLHVITKQQAIDMWGHPSGNQDYTNIYRQEKIYKGLFLVAENDSLVQANQDWTANWGAATAGNDIYVIKENFDPFNMPYAEATFVHELTHVWEPDLNYPLTFDQDKAHTALVEGDASFMGDYFLNLTKTQSNPHPEIADVPVILLSNPRWDEIHPMPDTLWTLNFFPYDQGKIFIGALYDHGGFATINKAYKMGYVPETTEQVIHPDKYFANETAQSVGAPTLAESTWNLALTDRGQKYNTYGEEFVNVMLGKWLNKSAAQRGAEGWAGDNLTYYERGSDFLFTWNIKWDTTCDASQFYIAFNNMADSTGAVGDGSCQWSSYGRFLSIEWNQDMNTTLIACSTVQAAVQPSYFSFT